MNFDKIFFRLLIVKTLYQCGLSLHTLVAPISQITIEKTPELKYDLLLSLHKYDNQDRFFIMGADQKLNSIHFGGEFTSNAIEFCGLYNLELEFLYRRPDEEIIWFKCLFEEKKFIQAFFRSIYSFQEKGNDNVIISKIVRYLNDSSEVEPFVENASLFEKDIASFTNQFIQKTYIITRSIDPDETIEADLIFRANSFAISPLFNSNKIALCIRDIPNERFLIRITSNWHAAKADYMLRETQLDDMSCVFPYLSANQISNYLEGN